MNKSLNSAWQSNFHDLAPAPLSSVSLIFLHSSDSSHIEQPMTSGKSWAFIFYVVHRIIPVSLNNKKN